jgi:hypothetical protein
MRVSGKKCKFYPLWNVLDWHLHLTPPWSSI